MSNLNEDEFNSKLKHLLQRFVLSNSDTEEQRYKLSRYFSETKTDLFIFINAQKENQSICSLANVRLILLTNFVAKFLEKK